MCNECCKEFSGWCRAFTCLERILVVLEAILLVMLLGLIVFLTLHMIVCSTPMTYVVDNENKENITDTTTTAVKSGKNHTAIDPKIKCTWEPSVKTKAGTHYYDMDADMRRSTTTAAYTTPDRIGIDPEYQTDNEIIEHDEFEQSDTSEGEEVNDGRKSYVIALVKMKPPTDITFGCILTVISEYWVLTAASCIEDIEELDSLDSFVMMEEYGSSGNGPIHKISDLQVHPFYRETDKSYDVAALRSEDGLFYGNKRPVTMVSSIDDALSAIGERFHLLGYGAFRSIESGRRGRRLRVAYVYGVAGRLCEGGGGALRHLAGGRREGGVVAPASRRRLCAGVVSARALPCNYCAGSPLLLPRDARLAALMTSSPQCGVACDPHLYLPLVLVRDWIERLLSQ